MILLTRSPTCASVPGLISAQLCGTESGLIERELDRLAGLDLERADLVAQVLVDLDRDRASTSDLVCAMGSARADARARPYRPGSDVRRSSWPPAGSRESR